MIAMVRLGFFGFLFLSIVYILVAIYSRSIRREKLEDKWDEEIKEGDRDAYISAGLKDYEGSLRRKLVVLVFIIPICFVFGMLYFINFY